MAITMSNQSSITTLESILGYNSPGITKVKYLQSLGVPVKVGLFSVSFTVKGVEFSAASPVPLSKADSLSIKSIIADKLCAVIEEALIASAGMQVLATPAPPVATVPPPWMTSIPVPNSEVKAAASVKALYESAQKQAPVVKAKPKPTPSVIKLKDARAIGQKVDGTSAGSVYRVAAIGKLNIAVREQTGTVSIRAEFQGAKSQETADKLVALGFTDSSNYLSMHVSLNNNSMAMRVIGSVIMGAGIEFEEVATMKEQLNG